MSHDQRTEDVLIAIALDRFEVDFREVDPSLVANTSTIG